MRAPARRRAARCSRSRRPARSARTTCARRSTPPEDYRGQVQPPEAASIADLPWWEVFQDEVLAAADPRSARRRTTTCRSPVARVEQARALVGVAQSPFYPQIGYQGSGGAAAAAAVPGHAGATPSTSSTARSRWPGRSTSGAASGARTRRRSEALLATEEFRRGVLLSLVTGVAQAYLDAARARPRARDRARDHGVRSSRRSTSSRAASRAASATSCRSRAPRPRSRRRRRRSPISSAAS